MRKQRFSQVTGLDQGQHLVHVTAKMQTQDGGGWWVVGGAWWAVGAGRLKGEWEVTQQRAGS